MARRRTKRSRRFGGCAGKRAFGSPADAIANGDGKTPYPCERCGCWHLTGAMRLPDASA